MAAARRVGVRELVDQHQRGRRQEASRSISATVAPCTEALRGGMRSMPFHERLGLLAPVRLDDADDHVDASLAAAGLGREQHLVGLADARRGAEEDLELAGAAFLAPGRFQQGFRRGALFGIAAGLDHTVI